MKEIVLAGQAEAQAAKIFECPTIPVNAIRLIARLVENGEFVGKSPSMSFFGIISRVTLLTPDDLRKHLGLSDNPRENAIEEFTRGIRIGDNPEKNSDSAYLLMWCEKALNLRAKDEIVLRPEHLASDPQFFGGEPIGI